MRDDPDDTSNNRDAIKLIRQKLHDKYQWARDAGVTYGNTYDVVTADAVAAFQDRADIPVLVDDDGHGIADFRTRSRLGSYPPPPLPRHACLTFAGTWAPPGVGYPSDVAQACGDVVEEIPVQAPWSFGPVPPGAVDSPSYRESVHIAVDWAVQWLLDNPDRTFSIGGYSQGAEAASRVYAELLPGGRLEHLMGNFVAGYTFGNPSRAQDSHTFYGDPAPTPGYGIADFHLPDGLGWNWIDCAAAGDIYTSTPGGDTGKIMRAAYDLATNLQLHDFMTFAGDFADDLWELVQDAVADVPAAFDAAGRGIAFVADSPPTRPHITYEFDECLPGMTHVQLAIQHVQQWSASVEARGDVAA
jgi:hypothetical protein